MHEMKEALKRRGNRSLDLNITIGAAEPDQNKTDLAPSVKDKPMAHPMDDMDVAPDDDMDSSSITDGMSDYDKESLMTKKPSSLGERARQMALMKVKK